MLLIAAGACAHGTAGPQQPSPESEEASSSSPWLCAVPAVDTAQWVRRTFAGFTLAMPRRFARVPYDGVAERFTDGRHRISVFIGSEPHLYAPGAQDPRASPTLRDRCETEIRGRPIEIVLLAYEVPDELAHRGAEIGRRGIVGARWTAAVNGRDVAVWVDSPSERELQRLRAIFWSLRFSADSVTRDR